MKEYPYLSLFLWLYMRRWIYYARHIVSIIWCGERDLTVYETIRGITYSLLSFLCPQKVPFWKTVRMSVVFAMVNDGDTLRDIWKRMRWRISREDYAKMECIMHVFTLQHNAQWNARATETDMLWRDCHKGVCLADTFFVSDAPYVASLRGAIVQLSNDVANYTTYPHRTFAAIRPRRAAALAWYHIQHHIKHPIMKFILSYRLHIALRPSHNDLLFHQCANAMLRHLNWKPSSETPIHTSLPT